MRAVEFVYSILDKYAPMNEVDRAELRRDANTWYLDEKDKSSKEVTKFTKLFNILEHWGTRTCLAILYIYILPQIQAYMDGNKNETDIEEI